MRTEVTRRPTRRRRTAVVTLAAGALLVPALPASAWTGPIAHPAKPGFAGPNPSLQVAPDGSALLLGEDPQNTSAERSRLVRLTTKGTANLAPAFPAAFGQDRDSWNDQVVVSEPDASGAVLVYHRNTRKYVHLTKGQDPSTATVRDAPGRIQHLDVNPSGAAAAIVGGGSTVSVHRRPAGPGASWAPVGPGRDGELGRLGQDRSYGVGITIDPNGGIFVVYETEQSRSLLQAYAPPGQSFGDPTHVATLNTNNDYATLDYAQSTNGHAVLAWDNYRTVGTLIPERTVISTRRPGGLLGSPSTLATAPADDSRVIGVSALGITDNGRVHVGHFSNQRQSACNPNNHLDGTGYLSSGTPGSGWARTTLPGTAWNNNTAVAAIATAGNHVRIVTRTSKLTGTRCTQNPGPRSEMSLSVRSDTGTPAVLVPFTHTNPGTSNIPLRVTGLAVGTGGHSAMVVAGPDGSRVGYSIFVDGPGVKPQPKPVPQPKPKQQPKPKSKTKAKSGVVKVPKSQKLKQKAVKATVSCATAGAHPEAACSANVKVRIKQGKKFTAAGTTTVRIAAGAKQAVKVTLKKKARKRVLTAKKKSTIRFVVNVTKKGATPIKVTRTVKVGR